MQPSPGSEAQWGDSTQGGGWEHGGQQGGAGLCYRTRTRLTWPQSSLAEQARGKIGLRSQAGAMDPCHCPNPSSERWEADCLCAPLSSDTSVSL